MTKNPTIADRVLPTDLVVVDVAATHHFEALKKLGISCKSCIHYKAEFFGEHYGYCDMIEYSWGRVEGGDSTALIDPTFLCNKWEPPTP